MAKTIPCDLCSEYPATFLVTFMPNGDTQGVGLECVAAFGEAIASAIVTEGGENLPTDVECFQVTLIPDGDQLALTVNGLLGWCESTVAAIDAQAAAEAAGPDVEPIRRPGKATKARKARKAPSGPVAAPEDPSDEAWEESGLAGRPPLAEPEPEPMGDGPGLEEAQA